MRGRERGLQEGQSGACERKRARAAGRTGSRMREEESAGCRKDSQAHVRGGERGLQEGQEAA